MIPKNKSVRMENFENLLDDKVTLKIPNDKPLICTTKSGIWHNQPGRKVKIHKIELTLQALHDPDWEKPGRVCIPVEGGYGDGEWYGVTVDVKAYFTKKSWDTIDDGLIYADDFWLKDFNRQVQKMFPNIFVVKCQGTEHGMQGDDYVFLEMFPLSVSKIDRFVAAAGAV
jgi:hypothetical protein